MHPIGPESYHQLAPQGYEPFTSALSMTHMNHLLLGIEIARLKHGHFPDPQPRGINEGKKVRYFAVVNELSTRCTSPGVRITGSGAFDRGIEMKATFSGWPIVFR